MNISKTLSQPLSIDILEYLFEISNGNKFDEGATMDKIIEVSNFTVKKTKARVRLLYRLDCIRRNHGVYYITGSGKEAIKEFV